MHVGFPFLLDGRGQTADPDQPAHIRQLIEQVLFTTPGERVNRPAFGCGLLEAVFGSTRSEELAALRFLVQDSLQKWLGELIEVEAVSLSHRQSVLFVRVRYAEAETGKSRMASFEVRAQ